VGQAGVVSLGLDAVAVQVLGNLLGGFLQGDVDDTGLIGTLAHPLDQAPTLVGTAHRFHQQVEVGPVEARGDHVVRRNGELGLHVGNHPGRGGSRQQQRLGDVELTLVVWKFQIVRTEIVAPL